MFLFFFIGIYLDNTLPHAYGLRKHWCFCLSPKFWCGRNKQLMKKRSPRNSIDANDKGGDNEEVDSFFEAKYMKRENFEPVSRDL